MPHNSAPARLEPLVIATCNPGKLREFRALLEGLPFEVRSLADFGAAGPAETGATFLANATLKARHAADITGMAAIADDSGLEVDALDGAPGMYSARYAGPDCDEAANNAKLLGALKGLPMARRRARYRCVLVFVSGPGDREPLHAEGVWEGYIALEPAGTGGFGYDPYFWLPGPGVTAAQLSAESKNRLSHRGAALRALRAALAGRVV